jgi:hypothetical protein
MYRYLWSTPTPLRPPRATARRAGPNAVHTGAFPMTRKGGASRASALRRVAPSGRIRARVRARASRAAARWRDSSRPSPCSRAIPVYGMMDAHNRNTRYGKTGPGIYRYIPVFYHTGIYPPKYSGRHTPPCCQPPSRGLCQGFLEMYRLKVLWQQ